MTGIRLEAISKTFGGVQAVRDMSLDVAQGQFVTLVGPSGCGKSTLLNVTAGLERPSGGRIFVGGREVTLLPPGQRNIAMVFQNYALYPHLNVRQNLGFPLRVQRKPRSEIGRRVAEVADLMEIGALLHRRPRELSGGQRQRVAIGRAIIRSSSVCLLDEPLSNLDAALRVRMRAELKLLFARMGTTILFVTHDQSEAMTMSDRIVVLREGSMQQQGTPLEVYRNPANAFVATFIGSPQMNIVPVDVTSVDGWPALGSGALRLPVPDRIAARLARYDKPRVLLGLRPEDVAISPFERGAGVEANVALIEHLGHGAILHFVGEGLPRLVGMETRDIDVAAGWRGKMQVNLDAIRLFDIDDETALT